MDWSRIRVVYGSTAISEAPSDPFFDKLARKGEGTIQVGLLFFRPHRKPDQLWERLFLIGLLLRDQYHRGKGCQSSQNAIKRRFN